MLALLALAATALSACTPTPEPTPTPTAAFASEEEAFAAAEEVYRDYIDASSSVDYADPDTFEALDAFTTGSYQADEREGLSTMYAEGNSRTGEIKVVWFRGVEIEDESTIRARTCNDVSGTAVFDKDGASLVPDDRPSHYAIDLVFVVEQQEVLISTSQAVEDSTCGG